MNNEIEQILQYIPQVVLFFLGDAPILMVLLGLVFILLGLFLVVVYIIPRAIGYRVDGRVVGGLREVRLKRKVRDGKEVTRQKISYRPIFEYTRADGNTVQTKASQGGDIIKGLQTDELIELVVWEHKDYDDVYVADSKASLILGAILIGFGIAITYAAGSFLASLRIGGLTIAIAVLFLIFRIVMSHLTKPRGKKKQTEDNKKTKNHKDFDPADIQPIEILQAQYAEERKQKSK